MQLQQDIKEQKVDVNDMNIISIGKAHMLEYSTTGKKVAKGKGGCKCGKMGGKKESEVICGKQCGCRKKKILFKCLLVLKQLFKLW